MTNLMLSMNQFEQLIGLTRDHMRDSLFVYKATSSTGDTCHFGIESAAKAWAKGGTVEAIKVREFKLHTSSPTAAPVGERELPPLPSYARWEERIKMLMQQCGHPNSMSIYQAFKQFQNEFEHEMIAYARAALSAGDAVDAQRYRWLMDNCTLGIKQNGVGWILNTSACVAPDCIKDVGAAIDAAMRKGQP